MNYLLWVRVDLSWVKVFKWFFSSILFPKFFDLLSGNNDILSEIIVNHPVFKHPHLLFLFLNHYINSPSLPNCILQLLLPVHQILHRRSLRNFLLYLLKFLLWRSTHTSSGLPFFGSPRPTFLGFASCWLTVFLGLRRQGGRRLRLCSLRFIHKAHLCNNNDYKSFHL